MAIGEKGTDLILKDQNNGPQHDELAAFVERLVPELQRCGIFRREHEGATLDEHLDLPRPANRFHTNGSKPTPAAERRVRRLLSLGGVARRPSAGVKIARD